MQLVLFLVFLQEVPQHVLIVAAAIDKAPEVEPMRPNLYLVVVTARNQAIELVPTKLDDLLAMAETLSDNHPRVLWVFYSDHQFLVFVCSVT